MRKTRQDIPIIEQIARKYAEIETLETRKSDDKDFHEIAVWTLKAMLEAAYRAGKEGRKIKPRFKKGEIVIVDGCLLAKVEFINPIGRTVEYQVLMLENANDCPKGQIHPSWWKQSNRNEIRKITERDRAFYSRLFGRRLK